MTDSDKMKERAYLLELRRNMPLDDKIKFTVNRIKWFIDYASLPVNIMFSGGLDSTVLLHIARKYVNPHIPAVFSNTGVEFPEIVRFVKATPGTEILRPQMSYAEVLKVHGYPVVTKQISRFIWDVRNSNPNNQKTVKLRMEGVNSKGKISNTMKIPEKWKFLINAPFKISHKCCDCLKKSCLKKFIGLPVVGTMAGDSQTRRRDYLLNGCNIYEGGAQQCRPLSFWSSSDVKEYIRSENVPYCEIYDAGYSHTGCVSCGFGVHLEKGENRFQMMQRTHPALWDAHINRYGWGEVLKFMGVPFHTNDMSFLD